MLKQISGAVLLAITLSHTAQAQSISSPFLDIQNANEDTASLDVKIPLTTKTSPAFVALYDSEQNFNAAEPLMVKPLNRLDRWTASFDNIPVGRYAFVVVDEQRRVISRISTYTTRSLRYKIKEDDSERPEANWDNLDFTLYDGHTVKILTEDHLRDFPVRQLAPAEDDIRLMAASVLQAAK